MLSIAPVRNGDYGAYLAGGTAEGYYGQEEEGFWKGDGAKELGLTGKVDGTALRNLLQGFSKDAKEKLAQNAGDKRRQCGWDLTFNAPKGVSVAWAIGDWRSRRRIQRALSNAVAKVVRAVEQELGASRRDKAGSRTEKAALTFAVYTHGLSRDRDPHLHVHVLVVNLGVRRDGTTGAIVSKPLYEHKMDLGKRFRDHLSKNLERFGLPIERRGDRFDLQGISKDVKRAFSQRRNSIERVLEKVGLDSPQAARAAALATREKKPTASREELHAEWRTRAMSLGLEPESIALLFGRSRHRGTPSTAADVPPQTERTAAPKNSEIQRRTPGETGPKPTGDDKSKDGVSKKQLRDLAAPTDKQGEAERQKALEDSLSATIPKAPPDRSRRDLEWRERVRSEAVERGSYGQTLFKIPFTKFEVRWVKSKVFWKAPNWSPFSRIRIGRLALAKEGEPVWKRKESPNPEVLSRKSLMAVPGIPAELQLTRTQLFPNAPSWSFAQRLVAYRLAFAAAKKPRVTRSRFGIRKGLRTGAARLWSARRMAQKRGVQEKEKEPPLPPEKAHDSRIPPGLYR